MINKETFIVKGFLGDEAKCCCAALDLREKDGLCGVFVDADGKGECFNSELAVEITIPQPEDAVSYVSINRYSESWCRPNFGGALSSCPDETQDLLIKNRDGSYTVLLPVCGSEYKCVLEGVPEGGLRAKVYSWYAGLDTCQTLAFVTGTGRDPYTLMHDCAKYAVELLGNYTRMREDRPYPEIFEYLGWCSWDAFQIRVTEDDLVGKCREFREKDIPVRWAILDDMWGDVKNFLGKKYANFHEMVQLQHQSPLDSFEAAPERFPNGLAHCIREMEKYGIDVGMWHPTTGYWKGISPDGPIFREHRDCLIERVRDGVPRYVHGVTKEQAFAFYDAYHKVLKDAGAKFMKVDYQSCIRAWYKGLLPVGRIARNMHEAIEDSVYKYFNGDLINCMGMPEENIWNRPRTAVSRCSGDFQPENREWFTKHILQCSYNGFYQGQLYWCDWDMWWSDDGQGVKNSVVRAVSGGPIYVSDTAERSRASVLKPLCLYDGKILRCDVPAMPTKDCLIVDPETSRESFKIFSRCGDSYMIAAFDLNAENKPVSVTFSLDALGASPAADTYLVYEHFTGSHTLIAKDGGFTDRLADQDTFRLYTVAPVKDGFAFVGLTGKFIGVKTAKGAEKDGFTLFESGGFAFYSETPVARVTADGKEAAFTNDGGFYSVPLPEEKRSVKIEILYQ